MIHPTAFVEPSVELGKDVSVGPYSVLKGKLFVRDRVKIAHHVTIEGFCEIGEDTEIFPYACIGSVPQDLKFGGEESWVKIGKRNLIREFVTINRGTSHGGGVTKIGDNNLIMAYAHIAHDCKIGNNVVIANAATFGGHIEIEDHAIVGGLVAVHQFVKIGAYAFVGGASALSMDAPPYITVVGNRAKIYGLNIIGLRRKGFSEERIKKLQKAFRIIFRSHIPRRDALNKVLEEIPDSDDVKHLVEFIKASKRGVPRLWKESE